MDRIICFIIILIIFLFGMIADSVIAYEPVKTAPLFPPTKDQTEKNKDPIPPKITILSPKNKDICKNIQIIGYSATDNEAIAFVQLYVDDNYVSQVLGDCNIIIWDTTKVKTGSHTIKLRAFDNARNTTFSNKITVIK